MAEQSLEEQETHASMNANDRGTWELFIDDLVMQRRFEAAGATLVSETKSGGKFYTIPYSQFQPRKPRAKRILTDEQRYILSKRLSESRKPSVE